MTTDLTPSVPKAALLDRFTNRLGALLPTLDPETASTHAEATFADAADQSPEAAADIIEIELPPNDPGAPRRLIGEVGPQRLNRTHEYPPR